VKKFRKFLKVLAVVLALPAVIAVSVYSLDQKGFFQIQNIEISVSALSSQKNFIAPKMAELNQKMDAFKGMSLWRFPLSQAANLLKQENWIQDFQLSRSWPSSLEIQIQPQPVAFLIQTGDPGQVSSYFTPVTQAGEMLAKIDSKEAPNTIVIHDGNFLKNKKVRDGALTLLKALPNQGRLHPSQVSEVGYDKKEGYWIRLLQSEVKINLGEEQFEIKSARVAQVIDYLENRDLKARVIDANLSKKVLVRMH
jgi:cell division protein FtsQ